MPKLLEVQGVSDYVLLVGQKAVEIGSVVPIYILGVVGVGPQRVGDFVGSNCKIGVVTDEAAAELVASIYRCGSRDPSCSAQLAH